MAKQRGQIPGVHQESNAHWLKWAICAHKLVRIADVRVGSRFVCSSNACRRTNKALGSRDDKLYTLSVI